MRKRTVCVALADWGELLCCLCDDLPFEVAATLFSWSKGRKNREERRRAIAEGKRPLRLDAWNVAALLLSVRPALRLLALTMLLVLHGRQ